MGCCNQRQEKENEIKIDENQEVDQKRKSQYQKEELHKTNHQQSIYQQENPISSNQGQMQINLQSDEIVQDVKQEEPKCDNTNLKEKEEQKEIFNQDQQAQSQDQKKQEQDSSVQKKDQENQKAQEKDNQPSNERLNRLEQAFIKLQDLKPYQQTNFQIFTCENGIVMKSEEEAMNLLQLKDVIERIMTRKQSEKKRRATKELIHYFKAKAPSVLKKKNRDSIEFQHFLYFQRIFHSLLSQ